MRSGNVKNLYGFLPHEKLKVFAGTIHAKTCCTKAVLYLLIYYIQLRIFSAEYGGQRIPPKAVSETLQGV